MSDAPPSPEFAPPSRALPREVYLGQHRPVNLCVVNQPNTRWFWDAVNNRNWENNTLNLMAQLLTSGWSWIDVGAWIGPTVLYAAKLGTSKIIAYEPDAVAVAELTDNISMLPNHLRSNIELRTYALSNHTGQVPLYSQQLGNSESSIFSAVFEREHRQVPVYPVAEVDCVDVLSEFAALPDLQQENCLVKLDIEGGEFIIIPRLAEYSQLITNSRCIWLVSLHELNIHSDLPLAIIRKTKVINLLEHFRHLNWYDMELLPLDKAKYIRGIFDGLEPYHQSLVFSNQQLTPIL